MITCPECGRPAGVEGETEVDSADPAYLIHRCNHFCMGCGWVGEVVERRIPRQSLSKIKSIDPDQIRRAKHDSLYRLPGGATVLVAGSPGDVRTERNLRVQIRRLNQ